MPFNTSTFNDSGDDTSAPVAGVPARDLVYAAFRKISVLGAAGRSYSISQGNDGLAILNRMLESFQLQNLLIWAQLRSVYPLVAGKQDYTIGPDGTADIAAPRPMELNRASIITTNGGSAQPLELPIGILTYQQWQVIPVKAIGSPIPQRVYLETSVPNAVLHFWPYPSVVCNVALYVAQPLQQIASLDDQYVLPPGYARAIVFNLACEMADDFPRAVLKPTTVQIARESLGWLKRKNHRPLDITCDAGVLTTTNGSRWNIYTDMFGSNR